jgi:hypothetical protein
MNSDRMMESHQIFIMYNEQQKLEIALWNIVIGIITTKKKSKILLNLFLFLHSILAFYNEICYDQHENSSFK